MDEHSSPASTARHSLLGRTFKALQYREFRLLWLGAFTSTTGSWMQQVAEAWLVLQISGNPFYLGLTSFLGQLPHILFSLVGGALADRWDRRKILLASQYVQMSCAFVLTILVGIDAIQLWHFLVLVFIAGTGQAFGGPAYQALIPGLVKREDVPNAITLNSIQFNLARVMGPLLAGTALATVGAMYCFGINGLSFLAVIASLHLIRTSFVPKKTGQSVMADIGSGLRFVKAQGALGQLTILGFVSTFCGIPLLTLLPAFAQEIFHLESAGYAAMMACSASGSIAGALVYANLSSLKRRGLFTLYAQMAFAVLLALFALSKSLWLSVIALFFAGMCLISLFASITSLVQLATPEEIRGRVMSIFFLAFRGGMPLGALLAGGLADLISLSAALLIPASALFLVGAGFLSSRSAVKSL